jgi:4-diphosphocytidyl-2-C-methyl-D-erythritol kinase
VIASAPAKLNLALVVGRVAAGGSHDVLTVLQRLDLADSVSVEPAGSTTVEGFADDTLVRRALDSLGAPHGWRAVIDKRIPVASGLGGGSSDAAAALRLGNLQLAEPLDQHALHDLAAAIGADVPFFLRDGPQLGSGDGTTLEPVSIPQDFVVVLLLPRNALKSSTRDVYAAFDERDGAAGFAARANALRSACRQLDAPRQLAQLPPNDLSTSKHAADLLAAGAFRADVSGAGPIVYGLFDDQGAAARGRDAVQGLGQTWIANPAW